MGHTMYAVWRTVCFCGIIMHRAILPVSQELSMTSNSLPSVLVINQREGLSVERALKLIRQCVMESTLNDDTVNVALDDIDYMLKAIDRS